MSSGTFYPANESDGGFFTSSYFSSQWQITLGGSAAYDIFERFRNVTIPNGSTITSAHVSFRSNANESGTISATIYANDEDNPSAPTSYSEANSLTLTSASEAWTISDAWVSGTYYNTVDITDIIQEIVNRPGWSSGNAIVVVIKTDSTNVRYIFNYDSYQGGGGPKAELHVAYSNAINVSAESVSLSLTTHQSTVDAPTNINASTASLTFSENSADVFFGQWVSASVASLTVNAYAADIIANTNVIALCGSLALKPQAATISYDLEIAAATVALYLVSHDAVIWDGAAWAKWIKANGSRLTRLYYFTLTGSADGVADAEIPISSWQARRKSGEPTFLSTVIPWTQVYQDQVDVRPNGTMKVSMAYLLGGVEQYRKPFARPTWTRIRQG